MSLLQIKELSVEIGGAEIIRSASLTVASRQFVAIVGRNGAGKTTLLRSLMGAIGVSKGSLGFDGHDVTNEKPHLRVHRGIGYMPDTCRLVPELTARENILLPLAMVGVPEREKVLNWIVQQIPEVSPLLSRRASLLSGGQQKLTALARAMGVGRKLLVLDEPIEGVAPSLAIRILEVLGSLKQNGWSVLVADSSEDHVRRLADSVYVMDRGVLAG